MAKLDPTQAAKQWADRLAGSTSKITQGVQGVTESPTEKAAKSKDKWMAGIQEAASNGKWERGLRRVTLADWQDAMLQKGVTRIAEGARQATPKMEAFMASFFPYLEAGVRKVRAMPSNTFDDRINRMVEMARYNHQFRQGS